MRILLAHNSTYYPAHGGGDKSNRLLVEALAGRGHEVRVVARTSGVGPSEHARLLQDLEQRGVPVREETPDRVSFQLNGVDVQTMTMATHLRAHFAAQVESFEPDVILASTDDPAQLLLEAALRSPTARVVYLARATIALPFGPDSAFPSAPKADALRQLDAAVGVSEYVARYLRLHGRMDAVHVPISLQEPGPWPDLGRFDNEFVTLVNPCAVKGISLFLALAERFPSVRFAAVPTWGTNVQDLAAMRGRANVSILPPVDDIDHLLARTRVLLVPSLWAEARSRIVVEAMLRGVPVMASNVGGIPEAKLGVDYLLPVRAIERYRPEMDENMVPVADVPPQDPLPWARALERLSDPGHHESLARQSRAAALAYAGSLGVRPFEELLERTVAQPQRSRAPAGNAGTELERLTPEKRKLLALRLRQRTANSLSPWFPNPERDDNARLRLFCFPFAGGGTTTFRGWARQLLGDTAVWPVRPPGRESRLTEAPLDRMAPLVAALVEALAPHLDRPFAFFGHSMGATVAFEVARALRRLGRPLPVGLVASAARAPQFRLHHRPEPDPTDEELLAQVRGLEGAGEEALAAEEYRQLVLPALRADAALYRHYTYQPDEPLPIPVRAYGGAEDARLPLDTLEAWREQTTRSFAVRLFAGGHFYVQPSRDALLAALAVDLTAMLREVGVK